MGSNIKTVIDKDGFHMTMKDRGIASAEATASDAAQRIDQTPEIPYPTVSNGVDGRVVVHDGVHDFAQQLHRQGACIVRHQDTGELFVVLKYTDGSVRRWS